MKYSSKEIIAAINIVHEILDLEEFSLDICELGSNIPDVQELKFCLIDNQKANLGDIENETFDNLAQVIDRMDIYHDDYLYEPYNERIEAGEEIPNNDWDRKIIIFLESNYCADLLSSISAAIYTDYVCASYGKFHDKAEDRLKENEGIDGLSLLINKSIAMKILETESAYEMVEYNGKIYINTDDVEFDTPEEFLKELKEYFNNPTGDKFFYEYNDYSEVVETEKGLIRDDIPDIGLIDENGNWSFYQKK